MRILFVRHGESQDDVLNAYGGWADMALTKKGEQQITKTAQKIKKLGIKFDKIITSPLKRSVKGAQIIGNELGVKVEEFLYVKERNTYGLLCGVNKDFAKEHYPELFNAYEAGEYVMGSEREEDIIARCKEAIERIKKMNCENVIVCTHGNFLKALMPVFVGKKLTKKEDGGYIVFSVDGGKVEVESFDGIEVE